MVNDGGSPQFLLWDWYWFLEGSTGSWAPASDAGGLLRKAPKSSCALDTLSSSRTWSGPRYARIPSYLVLLLRTGPGPPENVQKVPRKVENSAEGARKVPRILL